MASPDKPTVDPEQPTTASQSPDKVNNNVNNSKPPPPQTTPQMPKSQQKHDRSPPRTSPVDGKSYYGYLFNADKTATTLLDALLRAIANYIVRFPDLPTPPTATPITS